MLDIFKRTKNLKERKARPTLKIFGRAISSHLISFRFLPFSGHFRRAEEKNLRLNRSRKISWNRRKKTSRICQEIKFLEQIEKKSLFRYFMMNM